MIQNHQKLYYEWIFVKIPWKRGIITRIPDLLVKKGYFLLNDIAIDLLTLKMDLYS